LIGDAHWLSDGHHKEAILREFLGRYLPRGLSISRGFIRGVDDSLACSPEVDILIGDPDRHPPLFAESEIQVLLPQSVLSHISVKTGLSRNTLLDSICGIARTQLCVVESIDPASIWTAIFFFDGLPESQSSRSIVSLVRDTICSIKAEDFKRQEDMLLRTAAPLRTLLPTCIATLSGLLLFIDARDNEVRIREFDVGRLSFGICIADLFASIRRSRGLPVIGDLDRAIERIGFASPTESSFTLPNING
jgi:hypothetical protein